MRTLLENLAEDERSMSDCEVRCGGRFVANDIGQAIAEIKRLTAPPQKGNLTDALADLAVRLNQTCSKMCAEKDAEIRQLMVQRDDARLREAAWHTASVNDRAALHAQDRALADVSLSEENDRLIEENKRLLAQLPDGMKHCTILFKECEKGHGRLTAMNWIDHGCRQCEFDRLTADRDAWKIMAKQANHWNDLPQSEKEKALNDALESTTQDYIEATEENERLRARLFESTARAECLKECRAAMCVDRRYCGALLYDTPGLQVRIAAARAAYDDGSPCHADVLLKIANE